VRKRRVRVFWLIKGLGPGGAERLLVSFARVRDRDRYEYEVGYLVPEKDALVPELEALDVPVTCLEGGAWHDLGWVRRLHSYLDKGNFQLVHAHSPLPAGMARLVGRALPSARRPRVLATEHNLWDRYARPTRWVNKLTAPLGVGSLSVSQGVHDHLPSRLRRHDQVLCHGVDLDGIVAQRGEREAVRAELGIASGEVVFAHVANFRVQKAHGDMLAAARILLGKCENARFLLIGQGPCEEEIRATHAKLELGERCRILGYRPDVVRVMAGCDVMVLSSVFEGMPVAVMEALALSMPIVATNVGGLPEMVSDGTEGFLVAPSRPEELAKAMLELAVEPGASVLRAQMGEAAMKKSAVFDIRTTARILEDLYTDFVS